MAEKNENEVLNGAETSQEEKTPDENLTAHGEQPPIENPAPGIADGDVVIPSNVIDGLFEDKRTAAKDADKESRRTGNRGKKRPR